MSIRLVYNYASGSDTEASGSGPSTALTGSSAYSGDGASGGNQSIITLTGDAPSLSTVSGDGTEVIWINTPAGKRHLHQITAVDITGSTVTVGYTADWDHIESGSALSWAIGGKRKTPYADTTRVDTNEPWSNGWEFHFEDDQSVVDATLTFLAVGSVDEPMIISGTGATASSLIVNSGYHVITTLTDIFLIVHDITLYPENYRAGIDMVNAAPKTLMVYNCIFDGVNATDNNGIGGNSTHRLTVNNCWFKALHRGIYCGGGRHFFNVEQCIFTDINLDGIYFQGTSLSSASIERCIFSGITGSAIILTGTDEYLDHLVIDHCTFNDCQYAININDVLIGPV